MTIQAMFLRHEGFLGVIGAFMSYKKHGLDDLLAHQFVARFPMGASYVGGKIHGLPLRDLIEKVLGRDGKDYVHVMGQGVSKSEIRASAASREKSKKNNALLNRIENLEQTVASLQTVGSNTPRSSQSLLQFHTPSPSEGHDHSTLPIKTCLLKNFRKKVVAIGRVNTDAPLNDEAYNIIVDEIFDDNETSFDRDGKFDDITVGEIINWPKYSVQFIRF